MKQGWIKLHRSLLDWEWYDDMNVKVLFLHCLFKANHADKNYRGTVVKRGTFLTGRDLLAVETGLSVQQIRTAFTKLKSTNELTIKSSRQGTVVEVVNYDKFQDTTNKPTNKPTNEQPTSNQQVTSNKNEKNIKNEKNVNKFTPPSEGDFIQYLLEEMPKINPEWTSDRINRAASQQFETYVEDGWRDGFGKAIKNWKTKAKNCLTHKKPYSYGKATGTKAPQTPQQMRGY